MTEEKGSGKSAEVRQDQINYLLCGCLPTLFFFFHFHHYGENTACKKIPSSSYRQNLLRTNFVSKILCTKAKRDERREALNMEMKVQNTSLRHTENVN